MIECGPYLRGIPLLLVGLLLCGPAHARWALSRRLACDTIPPLWGVVQWQHTRLWICGSWFESRRPSL